MRRGVRGEARGAMGRGEGCDGARRGQCEARGEAKREEIASPTGNIRDTPYPYLSTALPLTCV